MLSFKPVKYKLDFCYPNSYATFVQAVSHEQTIARVCYLGVENLRMFLDVKQGVPHVTMWERNDFSWTPYRRPVRLHPLDLKKMLHSAQEFEKELAETFFYAFPRAEEAFYETLPRHKEVLSQLVGQPNAGRIEELRLIHNIDGSCVVDDAEGIITITCDDGSLCVPYDIVNGEPTLQMYRAKFHPYSFFASLAENIFDWCYRIRSAVASITWGSVLSGIDKIVK